MSYTGIGYYLHQVDYLTPRTATEQLHNSHAQRHQAARQVSQFDRPFLSPLPMPNPTSCWYPQQDVQFGSSYPDPARPIPAPPFTVPRPSSVSYSRLEPDPPDWPPLYTAAPPPYQPDIHYAPPTFSYNQPPDYSYPSNYTPFTSNITNLPQYSPPHLHDTSQNHQGPPPQRSPSCWSSLSPTSHCQSVAPLPAAAAVPSLNLPPLAPPCSPDIIGDKEELLDDDSHPPTMMTLSCSPIIRYDSKDLIVDDSDDSVKSCLSTAIDQLPNRDKVGVEEILLDDEENDGGLTASSLSPMCLKIQKLCFRARSEVLECMPFGPDSCATAYISNVNALMIYCPRRLGLLGILGVHKVDVGAINALAKHRRVWTDIGSIDCRKVGATSLGNIAPPF